MDEPAQSVRMPPGSTTVTLIPRGATSADSASLKPPTAHFADWYAVMPGLPMRPPSEEIWMIRPPPCLRMNGTTALVT
jgi:hypothetical protein